MAEVNDPTGLPVPIPKTFTRHVEILAHVRMEDECQSGKAGAGDIAGIVGQGELLRAVFVDGKKARLGFRDGGHVIVLPRVGANCVAEFIQLLMEQLFDCGKAGYVLHQFLSSLARFFNHLCGWTDDIGGECQLDVVNAGGLPRFHRETWSRKRHQIVDARELGFHFGSVPGRSCAGVVFLSMFLDFCDQVAHLLRHGVLRRFLQKNIQCLNSFLIMTESDQSLSENELAGLALFLPFVIATWAWSRALS